MPGLRTGDAIRSKRETPNPKGVTLKRGETDKQLCNTSYSLWDYRGESNYIYLQGFICGAGL